MKAAMEMVLVFGIENVSARLMPLKALLVPMLKAQGFTVLQPEDGTHASSITTAARGIGAPLERVFEHLTANHVVLSLRYNRAGRAHLRFSPHFYNTEAEMDRVCALIAEAR